jgi:hypothetical protein
MTFDLFLRFMIYGTRDEVNKQFRSIRFNLQLEQALLHDPFQADQYETRMQNSLCFIWKDLYASDLSTATALVDSQLRTMCSHLPAQIRCSIDESQRPTVLCDILVGEDNGKTGKSSSESYH